MFPLRYPFCGVRRARGVRLELAGSARRSNVVNSDERSESAKEGAHEGNLGFPRAYARPRTSVVGAPEAVPATLARARLLRGTWEAPLSAASFRT